MKIAQVAPVEEPVPPAKYGGTELVVSNLTEGLVASGHEVHLFAAGGSRTGATFHPVFDSPIRQLAPRPEDAKLRETYKYMAVGRIVEELREGRFDIIHNHLGWRMLPFQGLVGAPMLTTLHGPLDQTYLQAAYRQPGSGPYVSISNAQRRPLPDLNFVATVYNGISVEAFPFVGSSGDYFAFLGRMSPEKGPRQAILAAKAAGERLVMAAKVDAVDRAYFEAEVAPLIDGDQISFIGEVDHQGKAKLLGRAKGLLALIQWEEPFGLFMVEALACGTPVIALPRGSVPELIEDGVNGFVIASESEASLAMKRIGEINRRDCRQSAEGRFSIARMVEGYVGAYQAILER